MERRVPGVVPRERLRRRRGRRPHRAARARRAGCTDAGGSPRRQRRPPRSRALRVGRPAVALGHDAPAHQHGRDGRRRTALHDHAHRPLAAVDQAVPAPQSGASPPRGRSTGSRRRSSRCRTARRRTTPSTSSCCSPGCRGERSRCCARTAAISSRSARRSARPTSRRRSPRIPTSRAGSSRCSPRASIRSTPHRSTRARSNSRSRPQLDARRFARRRPHPSRAPPPRARDVAHQLVPDRRRGRVPSVRRPEVRPVAGARPAASPPDVRAVRVLAPGRGRAPPRRPRRARRHPVVRPAGRLPHRDPRSDEGPEGQERRDRAVGREGRVRGEAAARRPGPRCAPRWRPATGCSSRRCSTSPTTV